MDQLLNNVVVVTPNTELYRKCEQYLGSLAPISHLSSPKMAIECLRNQPRLSVVVIDVYRNSTDDIFRLVHLLNEIPGVGIVLCHPARIDPDRISGLIRIVKQGGCHFLQWPTFYEEAQWVVTQSARYASTLKPAHRSHRVTAENHAVLISDDYEPFRTTLSDLLEPFGYDLHLADSWMSTLKIITSHRIDIVLLDILLGDAVGTERISEIHSASPDTDVIMLTVVNDVEQIIKCIRMGAIDYVVKGRHVELLPDTLGRCFDARGTLG